MLTTAVLFPVMIIGKNLWSLTKEIFLKFIAIVTIFGQLPLILNIFSSLKKAIVFTGRGMPFTDRIMQYSNFVSSCFFASGSIVENDKGIYRYISAPVSDVNILGLILLFICVAGFIMNYKNTFAKICMAWIGFSFILLCVIGWGTSENGLVLYTLYFAWAFLSLLFKFVEKIPKKISPFLSIIWTSLVISLVITNIPAVLKIIKFGITYYPAR
jgi:hypothetical protein